MGRADLNTRVGLSGDTPLHLVAREFDRHRTRAQTAAGGLFAHRGVVACKLKFRLLVSMGADPGRWNCNHHTPLDLVDGSIRGELRAELSDSAAVSAKQ